jgi:hypothetical protein
MAQAVYVLCAITAFACAVLLARGYSRTGSRLLLWSALCFAGLTANNVLVFVDLVVVPDVSLFTLRNVTGLASIAVLLVGLVFDGGGKSR